MSIVCYWNCTVLLSSACCLLYYMGEINSGIHMYQFTFEPLHFCFRTWLWELHKHSGGLTDLAKKKHGSADLHIPIYPPPPTKSTVLYQLFFSKTGLKISREIPAKSAVFSPNLPLKIPRNLTFFPRPTRSPVIINYLRK